LDLNASGVFQRALEAAVESEEKALSGDRVAKVVARLRNARTPAEAARADGEAAGSQWAEDVATMSELKAARDLATEMERDRLQTMNIRIGWRVVLEIGQWDKEDDDLIPVSDENLPESVPREFFERAGKPYHNGVHYTATLVDGFLSGAVTVLDAAERAMANEKTMEAMDRLAKAVGIVSLRAGNPKPKKTASLPAGQPTDQLPAPEEPNA
jgi:hypothetical protein